MALFQVVFKRIVDNAKETSAASETEDSNKAGPVEAEKELLDKFRHVLKPFIADKPKLQLAAVYALQMSCNALCFPKGLLLRSFVNFYEMDIVDEHAFLQWKEDVNETYPGKGKALFQVNINPSYSFITKGEICAGCTLHKTIVVTRIDM